MMAASKAKELGCSQGDTKCLCGNVDFIYGLRDCSKAICSQQDAEKVVAYGMEVCKSAGVAISGGNGGSTTGGSGGSGASSTDGSGSDSSATGTEGGSGGAGGAVCISNLECS